MDKFTKALDRANKAAEAYALITTNKHHAEVMKRIAAIYRR